MYEPLPVSSEQVAKWHPLIERQARIFSKVGESVLAELDDLMQVGRIRVWRELRNGRWPTTTSVANAMKDELDRVRSLDDGRGSIPDDLDAEFLALDGVEV
jgi:hypothetical protein